MVCVCVCKISEGKNWKEAQNAPLYLYQLGFKKISSNSQLSRFCGGDPPHLEKPWCVCVCLKLIKDPLGFPHRQCKCLLRNPALIVPLETLLKKYYTYALDYTQVVCGVEEWNHQLLATTELIYQAVRKSFQLQYPLYQVLLNVYFIILEEEQ